MRSVVAAAVVAFGLAAAACGRYGPPVRPPRPSQAPAAAPAASEPSEEPREPESVPPP
jgi:hypothetical protein